MSRLKNGRARGGGGACSSPMSYAEKPSLTASPALHHRREEAIARLHARQSPQEFSSEQRIQIIPNQFPVMVQPLQFFAAIAKLVCGIVSQNFLNHVLVFLALERARRVHRATAGSKLPQCGAQNVHL